MNEIKRRDAIKSLGVISLGTLSPSFHEKFHEKNISKYDGDEIFTDILIIGGGTAGVIAALQAARSGCKTTIIENGSQLGGTISTGGVSFPGLFHAWGKQIIAGIGWELVRDTVELNGDELPYFPPSPPRHWYNQIPLNGALFALLAEEKCINADIEIRYYETPTEIKFQENNWKVRTIGKGVNKIIYCNQIVDCTGNALATSLAGFKLLRETETQPGSILFRLGGYDYESLDLNEIPARYHGLLRKSKLVKSKIENPNKEFPPFTPYSLLVVPGADSTTSERHTIANMQGRSSLLEFLRDLRSFPGCENIQILDMRPETAVRETFRIDGVYKIKYQDYVNGEKFWDSLSYSFYPIDLWREGKSIHQEYLNEGVVATVPLRALIPSGSKNFLVAGRCVSSDRLANSALRVQASCMGMGQVAGAAASLAFYQKKSPLEIPIADLKEMIKDHGGIVPS